MHGWYQLVHTSGCGKNLKGLIERTTEPIPDTITMSYNAMINAVNLLKSVTTILYKQSWLAIYNSFVFISPKPKTTGSGPNL